jgi:hypothetical protein
MRARRPDGWLDRWRREQEPAAEALYQQAEARFVELVNSFQECLAASPGLADFPRMHVHQGFRAKGRFYYTELMHIAPASAGTWLHDIFIPWRRLAVIERAATDYLERLLHVNSARVKNDFEDRTDESRRRLEHEVRERLLRLATSAEEALRRARETQLAGSAAVEQKIEWLDGLRRRVEALASPDQRPSAETQDAGSLFA